MARPLVYLGRKYPGDEAAVEPLSGFRGLVEPASIHFLRRTSDALMMLAVRR